MPKNNETTTKFKVDISDLKKNIQEANRQIRLANAEFKAASAGMDNWGKSADGLSAKINQTDKVLKSQKAILNDYKKQLNLIVAEYGENSKEADEMRIKIENQRATVIRTQKSLGDYKTQLSTLESAQKAAADAVEEQVSAYDQLKTKVREQESTLKSLKSQYASVVLEQGKNSDSAQSLANEINDLSGELKENKAKLNDAEKAADELSESFDDVDDSAKEVSNGGFTIMKGALANLVSQGITAAINGVKQLGQAIVDVGKQSISNYANYEQLVGGVETLFKDSAGLVVEYAENAYKTAGMSANEYMDTVTSFSASLLQGLGGDTEKAAQVADMAIRDMSDNANKMGTDMTMIQNAYQGFAKQNFTMLDNLKLGYGGTQAEMARLINESGVLGDSMTVTAQTVKDVPFDKMIEAIHKVQDEMGITGTTSMEAADTIEGSSGSMRAAWENLLTGLADENADLDKLFDAFTQSFKAYAKNFIPRVKQLIDNVMDFAAKEIEKKAPGLAKTFEKFKGFLDWVMKNKSKLIAAFTGIATAMATFMIAQKIMALVKAFKAWSLATEGVTLAQKLLNTVMAMNPIGLIVAAIAGLVAAFITLWNTSEEFREFWIGLWNKIKEVAEPILEALVEWFKTAWDKIKAIWDVVSEFFVGIFNSIWDNVKPVLDSVVGAFKEAWELIKVIWDKVKPYFEIVWEAIKTIFSVVSKILGGYFKSAWIVIKAVWDVVVAYFKAVWNGIKAVFSVVKTFLGGAFKTAWEAIKLVWDVVVGYFKAIWDSIKLIFSVVKNVLTGNWSGAWEGIKAIVGTWKDYFAGVWAGIKKVFSTVGSWFKSIFSTAWKAIKNVFKGWKDFFSGLWDTIKDTFGDLGDAIGDTIGSAVIGAINEALSMVESAVNKAIDMINSVLDVINEIPGVDIGNVDEISLPRLANGGVLRRGQVGLLEGSGAEAVVPLENNKKWIAATAKDLKQSLAEEGLLSGGGGVGKSVTNNYNFTQNNTSPKALSRLEIYRQTRNQLNFAKGV